MLSCRKSTTEACHAASHPRCDMPRALTHVKVPVYAGGMTDTVSTPTHAQGLALFDEVVKRLQDHGFEHLRVDTLQHYTDAGVKDRADRWTVRYHFTAGTWELNYEPDLGWNPPSKGKRTGTRQVRIRLDRALPTVEAVISELFGPMLSRYFPASVAPAVAGAGRRAPRQRVPSKTAVAGLLTKNGS